MCYEVSFFIYIFSKCPTWSFQIFGGDITSIQLNRFTNKKQRGLNIMKKKNKKRLAVNGKRIVWNAIKALVGVSSVFVVPMLVKRAFPDFEAGEILPFVLIMLKVADILCDGFLNDIRSFFSHKDEFVLYSSISNPERISEISMERFMRYNQEVESCIYNSGLTVLDWKWKNDKLDELMLLCRRGKQVLWLRARIDLAKRKYKEWSYFPIRRIRVLTPFNGIVFLENPNWWNEEEKSEAELALGTAVDDFVCTHCPESYAWRFVDAARTDIYIDGVDAYAGLPMTIHWNPDGTVHDITGYDPAWQRIVSVCGPGHAEISLMREDS